LDPIAFTLFGLEVRWYGILIAAAFLIGILIILKRAEKYEMDKDAILDIIILTIPLAIIGARLYYVIFQWQYYSQHLDQIIAIWNGGLAIHGGIIGGVIGVLMGCRIKKIPVLRLLDVIVLALPLGQAIGRWGNFMNGEAYGTQTDLPWAITVDDPVYGIIQVHPTFLYESIWNILVFFGILLYEKKVKKFDGELIFLYCIAYSVGRFFIEGLRTDSLMLGPLRIAQVISLVLIVVGMAGIIWLRKNKKNSDISLEK
jgi:phosphatidylglycerol:prolipoprotein diacylglycerol transferase